MSRWAAGYRLAVEEGTATTVACGTCTACCRSYHFVDIGPEETDALAHIPAELLFPAPGKPPGHRVMGHDVQGRCPMLGETGCTIYEHRPRACRVYDCRMFAASGVTADQPQVAARAERWKFEIADQTDNREARAISVAAAYLAEHFPGAPAEARAGAAVLVSDLFADPGRVGGINSDEVAAAVHLRLAGR